MSEPDAINLLAWLLECQPTRAIDYPEIMCNAIAELASAIPKKPISGIIKIETHWPIRGFNQAWPNSIFADIYHLSGIPLRLENMLILSEIHNNINTDLFQAMFTPYTSSNDQQIASIFADNYKMLIYILEQFPNKAMARGVARAYGSALYKDVLQRRLPSGSRFLSIADFPEDNAIRIIGAVALLNGFDTPETKNAVLGYIGSIQRFV
jgi:hypothetical protein